LPPHVFFTQPQKKFGIGSRMSLNLVIFDFFSLKTKL
jgi:hypothetical protein